MTITEFIEARLAERETAAMAASSEEHRAAGQPEHWRWECTQDDVPLDLDTDVYDGAGGRMLFHCNDWRTGLRSIEAYPEARVSVHDSPMPHLVLGTAEPVRPEAARHIQLNDPDRTMRTVTAIRRLMGLLGEVGTSYPITADLLRRVIASIWDDHKDYQARWK